MSLAPDGRIASQGALSTALAKDKKLSAQVAKESEVIEKAKREIDTGAAKAAPDGKLIVDEEVPIGHVTWGASGLLATFPRIQTYWVTFSSEVVLRKRNGRIRNLALLGRFLSHFGLVKGPVQP